MTSIETTETTQTQTQEIIAISQFERIIDAASVMYEHRIGCLIVAAAADDETMVGVLSERDILRWISNATPASYSQQVRDIMSKDVISCQPGASIGAALEQMKKHHMRHMPIVVNGQAVKMLSMRDLLERYFDSPSGRI